MAYSNYKTNLNNLVDYYTKHLIKCVADIDETNENFKIAEKYISTNLAYHKFLDTNKYQVQRDIDGLIEKLTIHSQTEKAERLQFLFKAFLEKQLKNDFPDIHYVVISMLLSLSNNPLESYYMHSKFKKRENQSQYYVEQIMKEIDIKDDILKEWDQDMSSTSSDEDSDLNDEDTKLGQQQKVNNNIQKQKKQQQNQKYGEISDINMSQPKNQAKPQMYSPSLSFSQMKLDNSNLLDRSFALPMQGTFTSIGATLGIFQLPKPSNDNSIMDLVSMMPSNQKLKPNSALENLISNRTQTITTYRSIKNEINKIASPRKRNYSQLLNESTQTMDTSISQRQEDIYKKDKEYFENLITKRDIWKNPNSLMDMFQELTISKDLKNQKNLNLLGLNHWPYKKKSERAIIQDVLLMLAGTQSETFMKNDNGYFELRFPIQLSHISLQSLRSLLDTYIMYSNTIIQIGEDLKIISEKYNTTVIESFIEYIRQYIIDYKSLLEDIQCIFLKQASYVKLSNLDIKHDILNKYLKLKTITLIDLKVLFEDIFINFNVISQILTNIISIFQKYLVIPQQKALQHSQQNTNNLINNTTIFASVNTTTIPNLNIPTSISPINISGHSNINIGNGNGTGNSGIAVGTSGSGNDNYINTNTKTYSKSFISSSILSYLYRLMNENLLTSNNNKSRQLICKLFLKSFEPYLNILNKWLKNGTLMDKYFEFFIKSQRDNHTMNTFYSKIDWYNDYHFQSYTTKSGDSEKEFINAPSFLIQYIDKIDNIGKSIKVLTYLRNQENISVTIDSQESFKKSLLRLLIEKMEIYDREINHVENKFKNANIPTIAKTQEEISTQKDYTFGGYLKKKIHTALSSIDGEQANNNNNDLSSGSRSMSIESSNDKLIGQINQEQMQIQEKEKKRVNIWKENAFKEDADNGLDLKKYSIDSIFSLNSLYDNGLKSNTRNDIAKENKKVNRMNHLYDVINNKLGDDCINHMTTYLDEALKMSLNQMEKYYSKKIVEILMEKFHLEDYFIAFRLIFFMEKGHLYESMYHELFTKEFRFGFGWENNMNRLNSIFRDVLHKLCITKIKNLSELFYMEVDKKEQEFKFSCLNNIKIIFKAHYPLDLIFDEQALQLYNRIFKFLLEIQKAKFNLTINNAFIKKETIYKLPKQRMDIEDDMDIDDYDYYNDVDNDDFNYEQKKNLFKRNKMINKLKRKFCLAQKELIHFVYNFEYFVYSPVIQEYTRKFENEFKETSRLIEISKKLKEYLGKIAEMCQINTSKTQPLFEVVKNGFEICADFNSLIIRLEQLTITDNTFEKEIDKIEDELTVLMNSHHKTNRVLFQILYQYNQKGYKIQYKTLFTNLNFNLYYMNESGEYMKGFQEFIFQL